MRRGLLTGVAAVVLAVAMSAPVAAAATAPTEALPFTLRRGGTSATYTTTHVAFAENSFAADFGALGEIDVHAAPSGGTVTDRSSCGGKPAKVPAGRWEGTIRFRGEEGFAAVDATSATSYVKPFLDILCAAGSDEGIGGHSPGALLTVKRHHGTEKLDFHVRKNNPSGPTRIDAELYERRGGIGIERTVAAVAPSKAQVSGDPKVDLPGRANVPLLAPGKPSVSLVRAVLNPSHPF